MTCERKCIKLDLHIDEEEELRQGNHEHADEVLCLRILSTKTKYRFGGLKIHVRSPVFDVAKIFNVEFDEESEVSLIRGQSQSNFNELNPQENDKQSENKDSESKNSESQNHLTPQTPQTSQASQSQIWDSHPQAKTATIVISPDREDVTLFNGPTLNMDLTLYEVNEPKLEGKISDGKRASQGSMGQPCGSRRSSIQLKKFVTRKINSTWHSAVRVKRFFADSIWN